MLPAISRTAFINLWVATQTGVGRRAILSGSRHNNMHNDYTTYMFIFPSVNKLPHPLHQYMFFILRFYLFLTPGVARQTHWHYLGRDSKRLRNTAMECLCVTCIVRYNWLDSTTYVWRCVTQCLLPAALYPLTLLRLRFFNFCEELRAYRFVIRHTRSLVFQNSIIAIFVRTC